jgi:hypothetical protein
LLLLCATAAVQLPLVVAPQCRRHLLLLLFYATQHSEYAMLLLHDCSCPLWWHRNAAVICCPRLAAEWINTETLHARS